MKTQKLLGNRFLLPTMLATTISLATGSVGSAAVTLPGFCSPNCESDTALDPMRVVFDENGNATIARNGGKPVALIGTVMADPSDKVVGAPDALIYKLPENVVSGTVLFFEPGGSGRVLSDALRFTDSTGVINGKGTNGTLMIFYSDVTDVPLSGGDTGFPGNLRTGLWITRNEVGPEAGNNGFTYNPGGLYPLNNQYVGISDSVPELSTWAMMAVGFAGLGAIGFRTRRRPISIV